MERRGLRAPAENVWQLKSSSLAKLSTSVTEHAAKSSKDHSRRTGSKTSHRRHDRLERVSLPPHNKTSLTSTPITRYNGLLYEAKPVHPYFRFLDGLAPDSRAVLETIRREQLDGDMNLGRMGYDLPPSAESMQPDDDRPRIAPAGPAPPHLRLSSNTFPANPPDITSRVPCKFYQQGSCQAGKACPFAHTNVAPRAPCKYFQKGNCKFGNKCALSHVLQSEIDARTRSIEISSANAGFEQQRAGLVEAAATEDRVDVSDDSYEFSVEENSEAHPSDDRMLVKKYKPEDPTERGLAKGVHYTISRTADWCLTAMQNKNECCTAGGYDANDGEDDNDRDQWNEGTQHKCSHCCIGLGPQEGRIRHANGTVLCLLCENSLRMSGELSRYRKNLFLGNSRAILN